MSKNITKKTENKVAGSVKIDHVRFATWRSSPWDMREVFQDIDGRSIECEHSQIADAAVNSVILFAF